MVGRFVPRLLVGILAVMLFYGLLTHARLGGPKGVLEGPWRAIGHYATAVAAGLGLGGGAPDAASLSALREVATRFLWTLLLTGAGFCVALLGCAVVLGAWPRAKAWLRRRRAWFMTRGGREGEGAIHRTGDTGTSLGGGPLISVLRLPSFVIALFLKTLIDMSGVIPQSWDHGGIRFGICLAAVGLGGGMLPDLLQILRRAHARAWAKGYADAARAAGESVTRHAWPEMVVPVIDYAFSRSLDILGGVIAVEYVVGYPGIGQMLLSHFLMKYNQVISQAGAWDRVYAGLLLILVAGLLVDPIRQLILRGLDPRYGADESQ